MRRRITGAIAATRRPGKCIRSWGVGEEGKARGLGKGVEKGVTKEVYE